MAFVSESFGKQMKACPTQQWMLVGRDSTVSLGSESHEAVTRPGPMVTPLSPW